VLEAGRTDDDGRHARTLQLNAVVGDPRGARAAVCGAGDHGVGLGRGLLEELGRAGQVAAEELHGEVGDTLREDLAGALERDIAVGLRVPQQAQRLAFQGLWPGSERIGSLPVLVSRRSDYAQRVGHGLL